MSTTAIWLFVAVILLFLAAVAGVVLAGLSVWRKGRRLAAELEGLQQDVERVTRSAAGNEPDVHRRENAAGEQDGYAGYDRRVSSRQEEVDHG